MSTRVHKTANKYKEQKPDIDRLRLENKARHTRNRKRRQKVQDAESTRRAESVRTSQAAVLRGYTVEMLKDEANVRHLNFAARVKKAELIALILDDMA